MTSRKVALSAAFLALAAGGTAACDAVTDDGDDVGSYDTTTYDGDAAGFEDPGFVDPGFEDPGVDDPDGEAEESGDEVFYCADEDGEIVHEDNCDDDGTTSYFLWHSPAYPRGLTPGTVLDGGDPISPGDRDARRAFKLPPSGKIANGLVKTNIVGRGSSGSGSGDSAGG